MYFGREAYGKKNIPVFAMPKMKSFLTNNGPWNQLIDLKNIALKNIQHDSTMILNQQLKVTPFIVPHRDEFSETVGYKIEGTKKTALFIPDIDKWKTWNKNIIEEVKKVDYAFLDATFLDQHEIKRAMSEVPHPFIQETIALFKNESLATKNKVIFINFNHTNPALQKNSKQRKEIEKLGFRFANEGDNFEL
jgi:pyrroloquinoline quinone biosynthesis protein B